MPQEEFMLLYEPIHQQLALYCRAISKIKEDAEDLMNETILISFQNFQSLKDRKAFKYYCFKIASNLNKRLMSKNRVQYKPAELWPDVEANDISAEILVDYGIIYKEIMQLPIKTSEALILHFISDLSYEDIREIQGGSLSSVKMRIQRGKDKLLQQFSKERDLKVVLTAILL